jgi:hypothetical protein
MNSNSIQKKSAHLRLVKSGIEVAELEAWEQRDAKQKHEDVKRESLASRMKAIHDFTFVKSTGAKKGTLH